MVPMFSPSWMRLRVAPQRENAYYENLRLDGHQSTFTLFCHCGLIRNAYVFGRTLESVSLSAATFNLHLSAVRRLADESAESGSPIP